MEYVKGKAEGKMEIVVNLLAIGIAEENVSVATGLSIEYIKALQRDL
ncbi:hypothetical protein FACS189472_11590 [Alphaproteobacteria bacterium]|nr:hypothetical protein FACS189472_11590 [Alphaproteobacteria bacterium]